jgi:hypothetical protein
MLYISEAPLCLKALFSAEAAPRCGAPNQRSVGAFHFGNVPGERQGTSPAPSGAPAYHSESTTTAFFPWKGKENIHVRS